MNTMPHEAAVIQQFHARVKPVDNSGCAMWGGSLTANGYGRLKTRVAGRWHELSAHRFAWELANAAVPAGMLVLHRCGNRACVSADHLYVGTPIEAQPESIADRFKANVKPSDDNGCALWTGLLDKDGYGVLRVGGRRHDKAHRVAWAFANGPVPNGLWVLHHCDNSTCVNPAHLYVGTAKQNADDRENRGRGNHPYGADSGNAKLTDALVREIAEAYAPGVVSQSDVAKRYGVSQATVNLILRGRIWARVGVKQDPVHRARTTARGDKAAKKLSTQTVVEIRRAYAAGGVSQQVLANRYGIRQTMVSMIVLRQSWTHI